MYDAVDKKYKQVVLIEDNKTYALHGIENHRWKGIWIPTYANMGEPVRKVQEESGQGCSELKTVFDVEGVRQALKEFGYLRDNSSQ